MPVSASLNGSESGSPKTGRSPWSDQNAAIRPEIVDHHLRMGMEQSGDGLGDGAVLGEGIGHAA